MWKLSDLRSYKSIYYTNHQKKMKKKKKINLLFFLTMDSNKDGIKIYEVDITKQGLG